ncbi:MAG TPA: YSC84-related protein [Caldimonas sp.]|jgi:lipid-binding SYLF domain-containing protein|nr:YSC84-related protein [Caldimonas sp.]
MKTKLLAIASAAALAVGAITGCSTTTTAAGGSDPIAKRDSIDANVDSALARLYAQDPSSRELVGKARGVLVFPSIVSAGLVVGGSYGQGALRVRGRTAQYYSTAAGSVGLLAGAESKSVFLLFMTDESLAKFRASNGWTVGADASVTLVNVGANAQVDSKTAQQAIIGYVLTNGGLMANVSLEGTKITPLSI